MKEWKAQFGADEVDIWLV
ncbi:hypothetical protein [Pseudomonas putida]